MKKINWCEWMRMASLILTVMTFIFFWSSFADFSDAKSGVKWRDISQAGVALWVFLILGAIIILLQLIPAIIMFWNFFGVAYKNIGEKSQEVESAESKEEAIT